MSSLDWQLLAIALSSIVVLIVLIVSRLRLHPMLALLLTAIGVGLFAGMPEDQLIKAIVVGAGTTLGAVGLIVALGAMLGRILADSGVTEGIASAITDRVRPGWLPWLIAAVAMVIGIPMFFEVGLVILLPLIFAVARVLRQSRALPGNAYVLVAVPVLAMLAAMHGMVPPHPGPLIAIAAFHANAGVTLLYGLIVAVPAVALGGPLYARLIAPRLQVSPDATLLAQYARPLDGQESPSAAASPGLALGMLLALLPALLMLVDALAKLLPGLPSAVQRGLAFVGSPVIAMLLGVLVAAWLLVYRRGGDSAKLRDALIGSAKAVANVLLIIAGGGVFQHVLGEVKVGEAIVHLSQHLALSPLLLGWLVSMLLSMATGSATVGIVGATGLLGALSATQQVNMPLLVLAIGSGSIFFNHANHAGFWLVKESFGMSMAEATMTIAMCQSIVSLVGLGMVLLLNLLPALA